MWITKRFTPRVLKRFEAQGRGSGVGTNFIPWHRVSRSDPSSIGRSHLVPMRTGRHLELLSDGELVVALFVTMTPGVLDLREQVPLSRSKAIHELAAYDVRYASRVGPGTQDVAQSLGIRHPCVRSGGIAQAWTMTTDLVPLIGLPSENQLLAIACKPGSTLSSRSSALLRTEQAYWQARLVPWLLITPRQYDARVASCVLRSWHWALLLRNEPLAEDVLQEVIRQDGQPLQSVLDWLASAYGDLSAAQAAFWQAVWKGQLPLDLHRGWRPHEPIRILTPNEFAQLNPVTSRRSEWS